MPAITAIIRDLGPSPTSLTAVTWNENVYPMSAVSTEKVNTRLVKSV